MVRKQFIEAEMSAGWAEKMILECKKSMDIILPLRENEIDFLDEILDNGEIKPELLTRDTGMIERIAAHPLLQWKAVNVQQHKNRQ